MLSNSSFSTEIPQLQHAWDSTSLGLLKTCPRKYYYTMIEQWASREQALALAFGIYYHSALEEFEKAKAKGMDFEEALHVALRRALLDSKDLVGDSYRNKETLIRAVAWHIEHYQDDPAETLILQDGKPAVELSFKFSLGVESIDGKEYIFCGHLDRAVRFLDQVYVLDYKTTKLALGDSYFKQYNPDNQVSLYTIGGSIILPEKTQGVIIDAAQLQVGGTRFMRCPIRRTEAQCEEWLSDALLWIRMAEQFAEKEHWPINDTACDKYGGCAFKSICSSDPAVRQMRLQSDFVKKVWNPLEAR